MTLRYSSYRFLLSVLLCLLSFGIACAGSMNLEEKKAKVAMRMIGHEVLMCWGDRKSRVMPIVKGDTYFKIPFEFDFGFDPDDLVAIVTQVMKETSVSDHYIVETEDCDSGDIVHSFQIWPGIDPFIIACRDRTLPVDCYNILITLLDDESTVGLSLRDPSMHIDPPTLDRSNKSYHWGYVLSTFAFLIGVVVVVKNRKSPTESEDIITMGSLKFKPTQRTLTIHDEDIELSHKESELLLLLHNSVNETITREVLLSKVWGDDGDYVGRTLDVFISKLRKKIESDNSLKIVNIRGVGYKLVKEVY